jgi:MFS family permease
MISDLGISRSLYASAFSVGTLVSAAALVLLGRQIDRMGERFVMIVAIVGFAAGLALLSAATGPILLFIGFAITRTCGSGVLTLSARTLIPHWFVLRRGWAFSMLGLAGAISLALFPLLHIRTVDMLGWRGAWRLDAALLLVLLLPPVALLLRNRPADVGQLAVGAEPLADGAPILAAEDGMNVREALRTPSFWALIMASVSPTIVVTGLSFNQVAIFAERGLPSTLAASMYSVESVFQLAVTLMVGWLVDRSAVKFSIAAGQIVLIVAMVCLMFADGPALAFAYAALRGACAGFWMVAIDVAWPAYFGRKHLGSIRGIGFAFGVAGSALGPLPFGFAYDAFGAYMPAVAALLVLPVVAAIAVMLVPSPGPVLARAHR